MAGLSYILGGQSGSTGETEGFCGDYGCKAPPLHHVMLKLFLRGRGEGSMPSSSHLKPKSDSIRVPSGEPVVLLELLTE